MRTRREHGLPRRCGRAVWALVAAVGCVLPAGCASTPIWERVQLQSYIMRADRDPLADLLAEHVYFTREAAAGGQGVGGGGCGCN